MDTKIDERGSEDSSAKYYSRNYLPYGSRPRQYMTIHTSTRVEISRDGVSTLLTAFDYAAAHGILRERLLSLDGR